MFDFAVTSHIVEVASAIMHADFASVQRYHPDRHALQLVNYRGFSAHCAEQLTWIYPYSGTSCAVSLSTGVRTIIPDIEHSPHDLARDVLRACGIRAMYTTPLRDTDGTLVGMCSTHWRTPHLPDDNAIQLFDIWAKQTADFLVNNTELCDLLREALTQIARNRRLTCDFAELMRLLNGPFTQVH